MSFTYWYDYYPYNTITVYNVENDTTAPPPKYYELYPSKTEEIPVKVRPVIEIDFKRMRDGEAYLIKIGDEEYVIRKEGRSIILEEVIE